MKSSARTSLFFPLALLVLLACACPALSSGAGDDQPGSQIGSLTRERTIVRLGKTPESLEEVSTTSPIEAGDAVQVTQGGEAILDLGDNLRLRLFNDTQVGVVKAELAEGSSLEAGLTLESGGFTGELTPNGGTAEFETPGGATIVVLGTEFLVVYDPASGLTSVGNFQGTLGVSASGASVQISPGFLVEVPFEGQPGPEQPLAFDRETYERRARDLQSPVLALQEQPTPTPTPSPSLAPLTPTLTPSEPVFSTLTATATIIPTHTPTPTPTNTPTLVIPSGLLTYRQDTPEGISLLAQGPTGPPVNLLSGKADAEVLDFHPETGLFALWALEGEVENLYLVDAQGGLVAGPLQPGWDSVVDGDWSLDGAVLVVEAVTEGNPTYYYYTASGKLSSTNVFVPIIE